MAQAGTTPEPDAQMASARDDDVHLTPGNNDANINSNDESTPSVLAEERSSIKKSQITNFADKYGLQIDPRTVSPTSLQLDNLNLDHIQVSVPTPALEEKDESGNVLTLEAAKRRQLALHQRQIRLARQGIIREELRAILRSPDFEYANSNPNDLIPIDPSSQPSQASQASHDLSGI